MTTVYDIFNVEISGRQNDWNFIVSFDKLFDKPQIRAEGATNNTIQLS
jgi:hypothetical protein